MIENTSGKLGRRALVFIVKKVRFQSNVSLAYLHATLTTW